MPGHYNVNSVSKAVRIVDFLSGRAPENFSMSQMENLVNIKKSTLFVLLTTLVSESILSFDRTGRRYGLGPKLSEWGNASAKGDGLKEKAPAFLEALTRLTRETSHLAVLEGHHAVLIAKMESPEPLKMSSTVGAKLPIHAAATAKVLCAHLSRPLLDPLIARADFKPFTRNTITQKRIYLEVLAAVKRLGYAVDDEEVYLGTRCVAAPVTGASGAVAAALGITAPALRFKKGDISKMAEAVKRIAEKFSKALGAPRVRA